MMQTSEIVTMSQISNLVLNLMYHAFVFSPVCASGEGQPNLNHNFSGSQMALAYAVTEIAGNMYQL